VFEEKTIRHTAVIGIAGQKVTDDIRKGLQILGDQAERLKREYGCSVVSHILRDEIIQLPGLSGRKPRQIERSLLARIIQPRMEEILEFSFKEIKRSGFARNLGAGVVLTGGGSMINSTRELAEAIFDMPVKIGMPMGFGAGLVKEIESPVYATAVGLVLFAFKNTSTSTLHSFVDEQIEEIEMTDEEMRLAEEAEEKKPNIMGRMKEWFEHL
jgi:cell division protein FtsA